MRPINNPPLKVRTFQDNIWELRDQMPGVVYSSTARGDIPPWSSAMYVPSNSPFILFPLAATGIWTQVLPNHDQNVTNDALDGSAMKAGCFKYYVLLPVIVNPY